MKKTFFILLFGGLLVISAISSFSPELNLIHTKAGLGKLLFSEKILSKDSSVSCASCHRPEFAFADTAAFSMGIHGNRTSRNTPTVLNMKNRPYYFWDGRAATLEIQSLMPIQNPDEMGLPVAEAIARLRDNPKYVTLFKKIFHELPNEKNLAVAFSEFEKTLETDNSRFDDWGNGKGKLSPSEENGRQLFIDKAHCFDCHTMEDYTDDEFRNIGLYDGVKLTDAGRFKITGKPEDLGKFKTPGLRNIAVTAPYMHNGMFRTLEEVVDYYDDPLKKVPNPINIDSTLQHPLRLSSQEKKDLVAFLKTLTDKAFLAP